MLPLAGALGLPGPLVLEACCLGRETWGLFFMVRQLSWATTFFRNHPPAIFPQAFGQSSCCLSLRLSL